MSYQTRSEEGELRYFDTLKEALDHGNRDLSIWKISFATWNGDRIRLIRRNTYDGSGKPEWILSPLMQEVVEMLEKKDAG